MIVVVIVVLITSINVTGLAQNFHVGTRFLTENPYERPQVRPTFGPTNPVTFTRRRAGLLAPAGPAGGLG